MGGTSRPRPRSSTIVPYSRRPPAMDLLVRWLSSRSLLRRIRVCEHQQFHDWLSTIQTQRLRVAMRTSQEKPSHATRSTIALHDRTYCSVGQHAAKKFARRAVTEKPVRLMSRSTRRSTSTHFAKPYENVKQPRAMNFVRTTAAELFAIRAPSLRQLT